MASVLRDQRRTEKSPQPTLNVGKIAKQEPSRRSYGPGEYKVVVMGASAGGIEAFSEVLHKLEPNFAAAVFLVLHTGAESPSALAGVLGRSTSLPVIEAADRAAIRPGHVYVARPDYHLAVEPGRMLVHRGPRENRHRPSIDLLFRTAARAYGKQVIAVILSGLLDDGTAGAQAVKARGGTVIVQDPEDALFPSMPLNALQFVRPDAVSSAPEIGSLLKQLVNGHMPQSQKRNVSQPAKRESSEGPVPGPLKRPMILSCPDCNGVLQEFGEGRLVRFRCQVGHEFSPDGLAEAQNEEVERALWTGVRALEESVAVARRMAEYSRQSGRIRAAERYSEQAQARDRDATILRRLIYSRNGVLAPEPQELQEATSGKMPREAKRRQVPQPNKKKRARR
jgi:two-component system chemotaxis response regulator CheB